jgi:hypothetical protein
MKEKEINDLENEIFNIPGMKEILLDIFKEMRLNELMNIFHLKESFEVKPYQSN